MQRYIIKKEQIKDSTIVITNDDVHHIKNVMRMNLGDSIICICDDQLYLCEIININNAITVKILNKYTENNELNVNVTIAQGLVRREKTEEVVRRLVELGCKKYLRVKMIRSVIKEGNDKTERLEKIIKEATEQSHRNKLMEISSIISFNDFIKEAKNYDLCLVADVSEKTTNLKQTLNDKKNILIIVGPEGGFDNKEIEILKHNNFKFVSLGKRVLRTETAPLFIMSIIASEVENEN